jgi:hypothetical protein
MVYIDMNMVRAGVVTHPSEWPFSGYNEIQNPRERYALIDHENLMELYLAYYGIMNLLIAKGAPQNAGTSQV